MKAELNVTEMITGTTESGFTFTPKGQRINSVGILVRRWFDQANGNTYFKAKILLNGVHVHTIPFEYGYDSHGEYVARKWVLDNFDQFQTADNWNWTSYWASDYGVNYACDTVDVQRKKDL